MKPLLAKTTKPFLIYVLLILLISIPVYYLVIEKIWVTELDEHNKSLAEDTETEFNKLGLSYQERKDKISFWNNIQPGILIEEIPSNKILKDSIFTADTKSPYIPKESDDNYRVLITTIKINNKPYYFRSVTSFEDTRETISAIAFITFLFFGCILFGLLFLSNRLSKTVWIPFRNTLDQLKHFNLNHQSNIKFENTDILEFDELNTSLNTLIEHNIAAYKAQKEFTENASHELQTPLAIIKNKLDILLQDKDLTESQYQIVEEMNLTLNRSARINKNLLLLAKIDNQQFDNSETIDFALLVKQTLEIAQEYFDQKKITVATHISENVLVKGNAALTETLINNLLVNTIRHTTENGFISIELTSLYFCISNSGSQKLDENLLFKRFSKHSQNNSGSGLGLAIVKEICGFQKWKVHYEFKNDQHLFYVHF